MITATVLKKLVSIGIPLLLVLVGFAVIVYGLAKKEAEEVHAIDWGLLVSGYTYFALAAGGAILVEAAHSIFGYRGPRGEHVKLVRLAMWFSIVSLLCAWILILADLSRPLEFWLIFMDFNPDSRIAWMALLYVIYIVMLAAQLIFMIRTPGEEHIEHRKTGIALASAGLVAGVLLYTNLAQVFGTMVSIPGWYGAYLALYFLTYVVVLGAAGHALFTMTYAWKHRELREFVSHYYGLVIASSVLLLGLLTAWGIVTAWYNPQAWATYSMIVGGAYSTLFWGVVIALGIIATFILALYATLRRSAVAILSASTLALIAGFINIYLTIIVHQTMVPEVLSGLYRVTEYSVSMAEAYILLGALIIWPSLYALGKAILPLLPEEKPKRLLIFK
jgi:Ni/Fe-hydrogenase subunit HybB-like protein